MTIIFCFAFCITFLMVILGHDPLRLFLRIVVLSRAACFYVEGALICLRRDHAEIWRWAMGRARVDEQRNPMAGGAR